jgi:glycosyl transferase family 2
VSAKSAGRRHTISVVVPVFNESAVVRAFYDRALQVLRAIPDFEYELLFVDDGRQPARGVDRSRADAGLNPRVCTSVV